MKSILQIAAGLVLGGVVLLGVAAAGFVAVGGPAWWQQLEQQLAEGRELHAARLSFFREQIAYLEAQQARVSSEIALAREQLRQRIDDLARQPVAAAPAPPPPADTAGVDASAAAAAMLGGDGIMSAEEMERKEGAWGRFYSKPDNCDVITDQATMVECGNHHIKRRREFEDLWERGMVD